MSSSLKGTLLSSFLPLILWLYVDPSQNVESALRALRAKGSLPPSQEARSSNESIVIISCGESRYEETLNLFKSIIMFSRGKEGPLNVILFADVIGQKIMEDLRQLEAKWNPDGEERIVLTLMNPHEKASDFGDVSTFAPCASLRLYLPQLLPESFSKVIYLDTDVLFLSNPQDLFDRAFSSMESKGAMLALATENWNGDLSYYTKYSLLPSFKNGLNSGVIFMDLDAMRRYQWTDRVQILLSHLDKYLIFEDQDIINFFYYLEPKNFVELDSNYNFRPDVCGTELDSFRDEGMIIHGSRSAFHNHFYPSVRSMTWFMSALPNNPLLIFYALKTTSIHREFEFFRNIYGLIQKSSPEEWSEESHESPLKRSNVCSDYTEILSKSLKLQLRPQT